MRIDKYLSERFGSRTKASSAVADGLVLVNGKAVAPSYDVKDGDSVEIIQPEKSFVSAGGYKLDKALTTFGVDVSDGVFADIGASTGGFTDCLFKYGAKKVYCIDVGENQLDSSLKSQNIVIIDNFNARTLSKEMFSDRLDGVVIDVSFISLTYILGAVSGILDSDASVFALIKPQFECESKNVGKNGIVKDKVQHIKIIEKIYDYSLSVGLSPVKITNAPIIKGKNMEYIIWLKKSGQCKSLKNLLKTVVV